MQSGHDMGGRASRLTSLTKHLGIYTTNYSAAENPFNFNIWHHIEQ